MAAENLNKSELKTNTSTRKSTFTLVPCKEHLYFSNLQSFRISGEISAEKMYVENWKIYRRLYDWGYIGRHFAEGSIGENVNQIKSNVGLPFLRRGENRSSRRKTSWIIFIIIVIVSNSNWTEWSTVQGVIMQVISRSDERKAPGRFEHTSAITPWIIWHEVQLLINHIYKKFRNKKCLLGISSFERKHCRKHCEGSH